MDTKQKSRSGDSQRRKRPAESKETGKDRPVREQAQSRNSARQKQTPKDAARQRGVEAQRQPPQQTSCRPEREPGSPAPRPVESSAEEVVFRPAQQPRKNKQDPAEAKRESRRRQSAQRTQERKKQEKRRKNRPAVTYTQPQPFNLNRLLLQLAVVLAVVAAITTGLSVFFKVKNVVVYGNKAYSAWTIQEASGIEAGDKLLSINNARASGKIKTLPYVDTVRIGIKLPDTVNIYIEEFDVAYAIQTEDGTWWLMTSEGRVVEQIDGGTAGSYTKVLGVTLDSPVAGEQAKAVVTASDGSAGDAASATDSTEETVPVTVTGTDRLNAALQILSCMEDNDIVGEVASVDVTSLTNIELWYGQRYQVKLGNTADMEKKISYMKQAVSQLSDYEMGVLDVSFTTWTDRPGYTPFE